MIFGPLRSAVDFVGLVSLNLRDTLSYVIAGRAYDQPVRLTAVSQQVLLSGLQAIPIVILLCGIVGVMLAIQGMQTLSIFGAEQFINVGLAVSIPKEFSPLIVGIVVAGRSGSQITSRVGSMGLNGELDGLTVMGIAPHRFVDAPTLLGLLVSVPILVVIGDFAALGLAGLYASTALGMSFHAFMGQLIELISLADYLLGISKGVVFAVLIGGIALAFGRSVAGGADDLGRKTTSSVVVCIATIIAVDALYSILGQL